jgi:hypothetical protein
LFAVIGSHNQLSFVMSIRALTAVAFSAALALAPAAANAAWHGGWHGHGGGGAAVGAAIAGGIIGLGLGAAAAANGYNYYYAPPPPVYYGYPYSYYYAAPPPVYYGYRARFTRPVVEIRRLPPPARLHSHNRPREGCTHHEPFELSGFGSACRIAGATRCRSSTIQHIDDFATIAIGRRLADVFERRRRHGGAAR